MGRIVDKHAVAAILTIVLLSGHAGAQSEVSVPSAVEESVAVRLVLVEVLVTDSAGRTVPNLTKEDFTLLVGYRPVEVDVLDVQCDAGALDDPAAGEAGAPAEPPRTLDPRRFVIALDWMSGSSTDRPFGVAAARRIVEQRKSPYDEVMIAVLSDGLHIAQPFTRDASTLLATLDAMEQDVWIWAQPTYAPLTPRPYFSAIARLMDVLEQYGGAKAVVMLSTWNGRSDGNDTWFLDVAHRAAESRTAIYPVFALGLQADPFIEPVGGSRSLARLANESGGRYTRNTNDLTLAYARAQRDLACRYTLGFYLDPSSDSNASRTITVRMNRAGLYARSPERMRSWSKKERRRSETQAAFLDPGRLDDPSMRVTARPLGPKSRSSWETIVAVDHPRPSVRGDDDPPAQLGVLISRLGRARRAFDRSVRASAGPEGDTAGTARLLERVDLEPGRWTVTAVLTDPLDDRIRTSASELIVPDVVEDGPFVAGPVLGTVRTITAMEATADDRSRLEGFDPLPEGPIRVGDDVAAVSRICQVGPWPDETRFTVRRAVLDARGDAVVRLEPEEIDLSGWKALQCRELFDAVPSSTLPAGEYRFEVRVDDERGRAVSDVGFRVAMPDRVAASSGPGITSGTAPRPN